MRIRFVLVLVAALSLSGCIASGVFNTAHLTNVQLTEGNYRVVATNVSGEASAGYLLGVSATLNTEMRTLALARVSGEDLLYQAAFANLWENFEAEHGPVDGRRLALVNVRYEVMYNAYTEDGGTRFSPSFNIRRIPRTRSNRSGVMIEMTSMPMKKAIALARKLSTIASVSPENSRSRPSPEP